MSHLNASRLKILITNCTLATRSGSETATRDLALGLEARGHKPSVYSPRLGPIAEELRDAGVPVFDVLSSDIEPPDLIHGHHHAETVAAVLYFRDAPAVFVCHDPVAWFDHPPRIGRIRRFIAVDVLRRDRLLSQSWITPDLVSIVPNSVDVGRFLPRSSPLPSSPRRALLFSNYATSTNYGAQLIAITSTLGLPLDVMGSGLGATCESPELHLRNYDVVFAVGRAAMEAMACGAACILCDHNGLGPLVTPKNVEDLWRFNFGHLLLRQRLTREALGEQLAMYDSTEAAAVQSFIRTKACLVNAVQQLEALYSQVLAEHALPDLGEDIRTYAQECCRELGLARAQIQQLRGTPVPW